MRKLVLPHTLVCAGLVRDADGSNRFEEVPLTLDDLFDPHEGDRLMHSPGHAKAICDVGARLD